LITLPHKPNWRLQWRNWPRFTNCVRSVKQFSVIQHQIASNKKGSSGCLFYCPFFLFFPV